MQISISGQNINLTDSLREYVDKKIGRLQRHLDRITQTHVVLKVEKRRHLAHADVHVSHGELYASAEAETMYAAIDELSDKLDQQARKHKEKQES